MIDIAILGPDVGLDDGPAGGKLLRFIDRDAAIRVTVPFSSETWAIFVSALSQATSKITVATLADVPS